MLETIFILCLVGLIAQSVLTTWQRIASHERLTALTNHLISELRFAQQKALQYQTAITWCASPDDIHCTNDWQNTRIVFVDKNKDQQRQPNERLIKKFAAIRETERMLWRSFRPRPGMTYLASGMTDHQNGTLTVCILTTTGPLANAIILTKLGRARLARTKKKTTERCAS